MTKEVTELKVGEGNTIAPFGNIASQVKELMDCLLSDNEIYRSFRVSEDAISLMAYPSASRESNYRCIAKAQLESPKLKAYIDSQVKAGREKQGTYITCPFCGKNGFDLTGLKCHLNNNCEQYQMTEEWVTYFQH